MSRTGNLSPSRSRSRAATRLPSSTGRFMSRTARSGVRGSALASALALAMATARPPSAAVVTRMSSSSSTSRITRSMSGSSSTTSTSGVATTELVIVDGQPDRERGQCRGRRVRRALLCPTDNRHLASMVFNDLARARQAEPGAGDLADDVRTALEAFEDPLELILRNADPVVLKRHDRPALRSVLAIDTHANGPAVGAVFDRVVQHVAEYSAKAASVIAADQLSEPRDELNLVTIGLL